MREYAAFDARAHANTSVLGWLRRAIVNWCQRRKLRQLLDLDDYLLADIGVTRTEVISVMRLAWYVDPIRELERLSRQSSRRGVRSR